jgi:hypothetical protein
MIPVYWYSWQILTEKQLKHITCTVKTLFICILLYSQILQTGKKRMQNNCNCFIQIMPKIWTFTIFKGCKMVQIAKNIDINKGLKHKCFTVDYALYWQGEADMSYGWELEHVCIYNEWIRPNGQKLASDLILEQLLLALIH